MEEDNEIFSVRYLSKAVEYIKSKVPYTPNIMIVCGSGLGNLGDVLEAPICINYKEIPNFPQITVEGHAGELIFGGMSGRKVMCMKGRFHYYEGNSLKKTTMPVRVAKLLGVSVLIVTNAAGSCNPKYNIGDIMVLRDHVNFLGFGGQNPLRGPNDDQFGGRFFPMNKAYDRELIKSAHKVAKQIGIESSFHDGVYAMVGGPNYESIAEILALRAIGVDAVGMSTVPEVLVAKHCGMKVFGFSMITNVGIADYTVDKEPNHKEVQEVVAARAETLREFIVKFVDNINIDGDTSTSGNVKSDKCKCKMR